MNNEKFTSGDPQFDTLQRELQDALAAGDALRIDAARAAVKQAQEAHLKAAQSAYMANFFATINSR